MCLKIIFAAFLFTPFLAFTQSGNTTIRFSVTNDSGAFVSKAIITAKALNNKTISFAETDSLGKATLVINSDKSFLAEASHVSYILFQKKYENPPEIINETIVLKSYVKSLDSVVLVSKKPLIVIQPDRYILTIDGKPDLGNTLSEIIKKAPGITINNNQVFLEGKPVMLQVDGKNIPLDGKELLNYLSSNSPININQIELITTPPSSMDASFTGGVINLKIKKIKKLGYNATLSIGTGMRSKYPLGNLNASINYRKGKTNIYATAGTYTEKRVNNNQIQRFTQKASVSNAVTEDIYSTEPSTGINYTAGIDISLSRTTIVGILLTGRHGQDKSDLDNTSYVFNNNILDSIQKLQLNTSNRSSLNVLNFNFKKKLDTLGQEINIDFDYNFINSSITGHQHYDYLSPGGSEYKSPYEIMQETNTSPDLYGLKVDYKKIIRKKTLEAGLKFSRAGIKYRLNESREIMNPLSKTWINDTFRYDEDIYAGYVSISGAAGTWQYRIGLRSELTSLSGQSQPGQKGIDTSYINLFPTLALTKKFDQKNFLSFSVRRSIARPRFTQLNPFRYYISPFYYFTGNPGLRPYFPYAIRLSYGHNNKLQITTSYSFTKDKIIEISTLENNSSVVKSTRENIGKINSLFLSASYYNNITKWWYSNNTLSGIRNNTSFTINNTPVKLSSTAFTFSSSNQFYLPANIKLELFGYYSSAAYFDASYLKPFGYIDISISKEILNRKGEISFKVNDVFYTNISRTRVRYSDVNYSERSRWDSRIFNISFFYSFGNADIERSRQRNTANSDERTRAN